LKCSDFVVTVIGRVFFSLSLWGAGIGMHGLHWDLVVVICIRGLFSSSGVKSGVPLKHVCGFFERKKKGK
jgi:hypothetical protein